jgi:phage-related holin
MTLGTYLTIRATSILSSTINVVADNWLIAALLSIWAFFEPVSLMLYLTIFAVGIDLISGLFKAWKLKEKITSTRLRDTSLKLFLYLGLIMLVYGIQFVCLWGIPISNIVASFVLFAEAVSIAENIDVIAGGKLGLSVFIKRLRKKWLDTKTENNK